MKPKESHWYKSDVNKSRISLQVLGNRVKEYIHTNSYSWSTLYLCWKCYLSTQQLNEQKNAFKKKKEIMSLQNTMRAIAFSPKCCLKNPEYLDE